jgi:hypothetical protein
MKVAEDKKEMQGLFVKFGEGVPVLGRLRFAAEAGLIHHGGAEDTEERPTFANVRQMWATPRGHQPMDETSLKVCKSGLNEKRSGRCRKNHRKAALLRVPPIPRERHCRMDS